MSQYSPDIVSHPGFTLDEMMRDGGITCFEVSCHQYITELDLLRIRCDNFPITENIAKDLEYFGLGDKLIWLQRQKNYDEWKKREIKSDELDRS